MNVDPTISPRQKSSLKLSGFTLIELLIVIAIIALLAAILFPAFARARENARRSSCQSNLKQIGLGILQYTQDYDESFPLYDQGAEVGVQGWSLMLQPYLKSTQVIYCPSDKTPQGDTSNPHNNYTDYGYNLGLGWNSVPVGFKLAALTSSARTVMVCDLFSNHSAEWTAGCGGANTAGCSTPGLATYDVGTTGAQRHLEGQNCVLTDGHVKWYKGSDATSSAAIYNWITSDSNTPASASSPTFNPKP